MVPPTITCGRQRPAKNSGRRWSIGHPLTGKEDHGRAGGPPSLVKGVGPVNHVESRAPGENSSPIIGIGPTVLPPGCSYVSFSLTSVVLLRISNDWMGTSTGSIGRSNTSEAVSFVGLKRIASSRGTGSRDSGVEGTKGR